MQSVDWRLIVQPTDISAQCVQGVKKPNAETFAPTIRLQDECTRGKMLPGGRHQQVFAGNENRVRRAEACSLERRVLAGLADFEVECPAAVDDAAAVPLQP